MINFKLYQINYRMILSVFKILVNNIMNLNLIFNLVIQASNLNFKII